MPTAKEDLAEQQNPQKSGPQEYEGCTTGQIRYGKVEIEMKTEEKQKTKIETVASFLPAEADDGGMLL
jgi:hypothetical protein